MKIPAESLEELRRICAESFDKTLSDVELQEVAQRIIRFLENSPAPAGDVDAPL